VRAVRLEHEIPQGSCVVGSVIVHSRRKLHRCPLVVIPRAENVALWLVPSFRAQMAEPISLGPTPMRRSGRSVEIVGIFSRVLLPRHLTVDARYVTRTTYDRPGFSGFASAARLE
jgi:hypothetical protein